MTKAFLVTKYIDEGPFDYREYIYIYMDEGPVSGGIIIKYIDEGSFNYKYVDEGPVSGGTHAVSGGKHNGGKYAASGG